MLQLFALSDKTVFNVFNSFVFVLLGLLVYFHANIKGKLNIPLLILYMLLNGWERICRRQSTFGLAGRSIICGQLLSFWRFLLFTEYMRQAVFVTIRKRKLRCV